MSSQGRVSYLGHGLFKLLKLLGLLCQALLHGCGRGLGQRTALSSLYKNGEALSHLLCLVRLVVQIQLLIQPVVV